MRQKGAAEAEQVVADWNLIAERIITCISTRDFDNLAYYFHPQVICRLLIPAGLIMAHDASNLMSNFQQWFGEVEHFSVQDSQITRVGDRLHVGYRIRLCKGDLWYLVEQQTYSRLDGGRIARFDLLCSGFRRDNIAG